MESPASLLGQFVSRINAAGVAGLAALMAADSGPREMALGWKQSLQRFPDAVEAD